VGRQSVIVWPALLLLSRVRWRPAPAGVFLQ
jgi:hypothetical protein